MNYKKKYIKYKIKYNKEKYSNMIGGGKYHHQSYINMIGGGISWSSPEYIEKIISSRLPDFDLHKCSLIKDIMPQSNEGRHNNGIGFITIEDNEYFLKYGTDLFDEFKTGYLLSKLKSEYPYFLNIYSLLKCNHKPSTEGQVIIVDKGKETIYNYLNRKSREYILKLIPDLKIRVNALDESITKIIDTHLTTDEKKLEFYELTEKIPKEKYDLINLSIDELIKNFYLDLSKEIIQFQTEFVPLFIQNYKTLINSFMIVDIFTINRYHYYIDDKKSDNFMVTTEPYSINKTHVNIKLGSTDFKFNNVCQWGDSDKDKEYVFLYPVDFGNINLKDDNKLNPELLIYFLNQWIYSYSRLELYSDVHDVNLESGTILSLNGYSLIKFNFSNLYNKGFDDIFNKYNLFKIKIFNPLSFYFEGINHNFKSISPDSEIVRINESAIAKKDYRFQGLPNIFFKINNLEEACKILQTLLNGQSVIYDIYRNSYRGNSNILDFYLVNGLLSNFMIVSDENIYKTFIIEST